MTEPHKHVPYNSPLPRPKAVPMRRLLNEQASQIPGLTLIQRYLKELREMEEWWLVLLPVLLWFGWRSYRSERQEVLAARAAARRATDQPGAGDHEAAPDRRAAAHETDQ